MTRVPVISFVGAGPGAADLITLRGAHRLAEADVVVWASSLIPAEVLDMPSQEAEDALVEYFRCISGEHPDWEEYREAMRRQGKSLIRITVDSWGPVATGGFPPDRAPA